jgi:hypothetical protein
MKKKNDIASGAEPQRQPGDGNRSLDALVLQITMVRNFPTHVGDFNAALPEQHCGENNYKEQSAFRQGWSEAVWAINRRITDMQNAKGERHE